MEGREGIDIIKHGGGEGGYRDNYARGRGGKEAGRSIMCHDLATSKPLTHLEIIS